jgi:hypothetical protein
MTSRRDKAPESPAAAALTNCSTVVVAFVVVGCSVWDDEDCKYCLAESLKCTLSSTARVAEDIADESVEGSLGLALKDAVDACIWAWDADMPDNTLLYASSLPLSVESGKSRGTCRKKFKSCAKRKTRRLLRGSWDVPPRLVR